MKPTTPRPSNRRPIPFGLLILLTLLALLALFFSAPAAHAQSDLTVTAVSNASHYNAAGWNVSLSNGITLFCPIRPFIDGGRAPAVGGRVTDFVDQSWFIAYYGYAHFTEGGHAYQGYRR